MTPQPPKAFWTRQARRGHSKRYGFVYIDRDEQDIRSLARIPKDSFYWYQNVIKTNGTEL